MKITEEMMVVYCFILTKKNLKLKNKVIKSHNSFVNGFLTVEIEEVQILDDTERGSGGFGSMRKKLKCVPRTENEKMYFPCRTPHQSSSITKLTFALHHQLKNFKDTISQNFLGMLRR